MALKSTKVHVLIMIIFFGIYLGPVHAQLKTYQPTLSTPQVMTENQSKKFIVSVNVTDEFGEIKNGNLSYSLDYGDTYKSSPMKLTWGDHRKGSYSGIIEKPKNFPHYVNYSISFIDDLGYRAEVKRTFPLNIFSDDDPPEIEHSPSLPFPLNSTKDSNGMYIVSMDTPTTVQATLTDKGWGIKNATLFYCIYNATLCSEKKYDKVEMKLITPGALWRGVWTADIDTNGIGPGSNVSYFINASDYARNYIHKFLPLNYAMQKLEMNTTDIHVKILEADPSNSTIILQAIVDEKTWPSSKAPRYEGIMFGKHGDSPWYKWVPKESPTLKGELGGDTSNYPFDTYNSTILIAMRNKTDTKINKEIFLNDDQISKGIWHITPTISNITPSSVEHLCNSKESNLLVCNPETNHSQVKFLRIDLLFERNWAIWAIIIPILTIFFLLGATFIFQPGPNNISDRLTLTLGIFALMFSLPEIINSLKPSTLGPTVADSLISIIVIATISYTVGSVIGSKLIKGDPKDVESQKEKWLRKWLDTTVFLIVCTFVIAAFISYKYPVETSLKIGLIIIGGLGFGLLFQKRPNILYPFYSVMNLFKSKGPKRNRKHKQIES